MSGFSFSGAAAGATDALEQMMVRRRAEYLQQQELERQARLDQGNARYRDEQLGLQQKQFTAAEDERKRQARLEAAQIAVSQARPGEELSPDVTSQIQSTPYAARLETKQTLPSSTIPGFGGATQSDPGGRKFVNLRPTQAQEQDQGQRQAKLRYVNLVKRGAPRSDIIGAMAEAGGNVPESAFDDPNLAHRQRLEEIVAQGDQTRRTALASAGAARAAAPIGPRDRVSAHRQADAAATDYLESLARANEGFLPAGVDTDAVRKQFVDAYMADLDPAAAEGANTRRVITDLRKVMPGPYGSRQTVNVTPIGAGASHTGTSASDPYEAYLARQGR